MQFDAVELFAGAGGMSVAVRQAGLHAVGYELDGAAVAAARANGFDTREADVTGFASIPPWSLRLLCGGPPCQGFSAAGSGRGRGDVPLILQCARAMVAVPAAADATLRLFAGMMKDHRSALVLEPLRWILAVRPRAVLLEQVPAVLPLWQLLAELLTGLGYSTWAGKLHAEQYGVPQTRRRAVLLASLDVEVREPAATHSRYYERDPGRLDKGVLPWVSMAEALAWGWDGRPARVVCGDRGPRWAYPQGDGSYATGETLTQEHYDQRNLVSNYGTHGDPNNRGVRSSDQPAAAITGKANRNIWQLGDVRSKNGTIRDLDAPAPTITGSLDNGNTRFSLRGGNQANSAERSIDRPAPTIVMGGRSNAVDWIAERPATTVQGDPRIWPPGHKVNATDRERHADADERYGDRAGRDAVRITIAEAAILQSFPPGHVFHGTKSQQFQQVGNAMPPLLALACLKVLFPNRFPTTER